MRTIPLRDVTGRVIEEALVDDDDFDRLDRHRWSLMNGAAHRKAKIGGRNRTVLMHREVMGAAFGDGLSIEHVSGNRLDNRKSNLRARPTSPSGGSTPANAQRARATVP